MKARKSYSRLADSHNVDVKFRGVGENMRNLIANLDCMRKSNIAEKTFNLMICTSALQR